MKRSCVFLTQIVSLQKIPLSLGNTKKEFMHWFKKKCQGLWMLIGNFIKKIVFLQLWSLFSKNSWGSIFPALSNSSINLLWSFSDTTNNRYHVHTIIYLLHTFNFIPILAYAVYLTIRHCFAQNYFCHFTIDYCISILPQLNTYWFMIHLFKNSLM